MPRPRPAPPFALAAVAGALVLATSLVAFALDRRGLRIFDAEGEWSWSHLLSTAAFGAGVVIALFHAREPEPRGRRWQVVGLLFGVLLVDNVTRLHTHTSLWPAFYAPLLIGLGTTIWRLARDTDEAMVMVGGLAILCLSLTFHVVGPHVVHALGASSGGWAYQIKASLKESTELAGWTLVVPGLWRLPRGRQAVALEAHA